MRSESVGEKRNDNLDYSHKEEELEDEAKFSTDVGRSFHSLVVVILNCFITSIICVAFKGIAIEVHGEVAVQTGEEQCVD